MPDDSKNPQTACSHQWVMRIVEDEGVGRDVYGNIISGREEWWCTRCGEVTNTQPKGTVRESLVFFGWLVLGLAAAMLFLSLIALGYAKFGIPR